MGYATGLIAALLVSIFGRSAGLDRERAFYSTILVVVAHYYVLFAAVGDSMQALAIESIGLCLFAGVAVAGFRKHMWIVAAGLVGHGVFDVIHAQLIDNPGVPVWWPPFCMTFDVGAGLWVAWLTRR